jgi:hypothetical protein
MVRCTRDLLATHTFRDCATETRPRRWIEQSSARLLERGAEAAAIILTSPAERSIHLAALKRYVARRIGNSGFAKTFRA